MKDREQAAAGPTAYAALAARNDGQEDCSSALQQFLKSGGNLDGLPPGTYRISGHLRAPQPLTAGPGVHIDGSDALGLGGAVITIG